MAKIIESIGSSDNLKDKGYQAIDSMERSAKAAIDQAEWNAKAGVDRLADTYDVVSDKAMSAGAKLKKRTQEVRDAAVARKEQVEGTIKSRPLVSTALAFGLGIVVQRLLLTSSKPKIK